MDLVEKDRPLPVHRAGAPAFAITSRTWATVAETAESSSNSAPVVFATTRASVVLPLPGGPRDRGSDAILGDREPERRMLAEDLLLPNEVCEPLRPHAECERSRLRQALIGRVEKRSPTAPSMLPAL